MQFTFLSFLIFFSSLSFAQVCQKWSVPQAVGQLDTQFLREASGLSVSKQFLSRMYHINDSGDGPYFYITDFTGHDTQKVIIPTSYPTDMEDLSLGPCEFGSCLFLADIGDNLQSRRLIEIWVTPEKEIYSSQVESFKRIVLEYPDHAHDAEAFAIHPQTGDLYILTKEADYLNERRASRARLFVLPAQKLSAAHEGQPETLQLVTEIDLPWINYDFGLFGQIATALDFSPDGKRLLILTYENAVEINFEMINLHLQTRAWNEGTDFQIIRWPQLVSQQESVAYAQDGRSFYFTSEFNPGFGDQQSLIYQVFCEDP